MIVVLGYCDCCEVTVIQYFVKFGQECRAFYHVLLVGITVNHLGWVGKPMLLLIAMF